MSLDAMKQALEALNKCQDWPGAYEECSRAITTLRAAIEQAHGDWDEVEALRASLREHMAEIHRLRAAIEQTNAGKTSDGYHTFNELYAFRKAYNAALFNELAANGKCSVHKSWRHYDGELCFGGGWFIVVAMLPNGQISNHYEAKDWDLFKVPATERAMFPFDGHTGADVVARLSSYAPAHIPIEQAQEPVAWISEGGDVSRSKRYMDQMGFKCNPLYTAPRQWQGLTDDEIVAVYGDDLKYQDGDYRRYARAIEAKLKEKNT